MNKHKKMYKKFSMLSVVTLFINIILSIILLFALNMSCPIINYLYQFSFAILVSFVIAAFTSWVSYKMEYEDFIKVKLNYPIETFYFELLNNFVLSEKNIFNKKLFDTNITMVDKFNFMFDDLISIVKTINNLIDYIFKFDKIIIDIIYFEGLDENNNPFDIFNELSMLRSNLEEHKSRFINLSSNLLAINKNILDLRSQLNNNINNELNNNINNQLTNNLNEINNLLPEFKKITKDILLSINNILKIIYDNNQKIFPTTWAERKNVLDEQVEKYRERIN